MLTPRFFISILIFGFVVTSCQKQIVDPNPTAPVSGDSTLLSMYIEFDTTLAAPFDTLNKTIYTYDNLGRNIGNSYFEYSNGVPILFTKTVFTYNGSDTLKMIDKTLDFDQRDSSLSYYTYDVNGIMTQDSTVSLIPGNAYSFVFKYHYTNNFYIQETIHYEPTLNRVDSSFCHAHITVFNNNVIQVHDSLFSNFQTFEGIDNYDLSYDNHPNPFRPLYAHYPYPSSEANSYRPIQHNNLISEIESYRDNFSNYTTTFRYQYKYKANGYPSEVKGVVTPISSGIWFAKGIYYYR